jgi:hypothetical protein
VAQLSPIERRAVGGDAAVLVVMTIVGFMSHGTAAAVGRLFLTMAGALVAWALVAPWFGVVEERIIRNRRAVWRVAWAWAIAGPAAAYIRDGILGRPIPVVFVTVTILTNGLALVAWRHAYAWRLAAAHREPERISG